MIYKLGMMHSCATTNVILYVQSYESFYIVLCVVMFCIFPKFSVFCWQCKLIFCRNKNLASQWIIPIFQKCMDLCTEVLILMQYFAWSFSIFATKHFSIHFLLVGLHADNLMFFNSTWSFYDSRFGTFMNYTLLSLSCSTSRAIVLW